MRPMAGFVERLQKLKSTARALYTVSVCEEVAALIVQGDETGERLPAWEQIKQILVKAGLATKRKVPPEFCAIDPDNRNTTGATGGNAQAHGKKIQRVGFSLEKCSDATSISAPEDTTVLMAKNRKMETLSNGLIPPLKDAHVIVLGANHTTLWIRQVKAEVRCVVVGLPTNAQGHLDRAALVNNRPLFEAALETGIEYFNLHADAFIVWPTLQLFVHRVLNTEARGIAGEVEIMMGMVERARAAGTDVDWEFIERDAASSLPTCESYIPILREYVQRNSGGGHGPLIQELSEFVHAYEHCSQRCVGGEFIEALLKVRVADYRLGDEIPYLKMQRSKRI